MHIKQHRNGDITFWFGGYCYAIKFTSDDKICYFVRYEQGRWVARPMTAGAFNNWYYSKRTSVIWDTQGYCKVDEFDTQRLKEFIKYVKGGVL